MQDVMDSHPELFPGVVDFTSEFDIGRSFRRGSASKATVEGLGEEIDVQNR